MKGHVSVDADASKLDALYSKFRQWNGSTFTYEDFLYVTKMNNRADELANVGIDENR